MSIEISHRVSQIKPSATLAIAAKAGELKAQGKDIISLATGEPDFDTPEHIKQAAYAAIARGDTKYTAVGGTVELRQAVVDKFKSENRLEFNLNEILISAGAKQCLYNLMQAIINTGDEVVIPSPYWVSYPDMVKLADGFPVIINTTLEQSFKINARQLEGAISDKTRLVIINSPSNPTGKAYSRSELMALGEVIRRHPRIAVVSDDIYEHIYWGEHEYLTLLNVCPDLREQVITLNGVSKAYSMTGWRIGYAAGPERIIKEMRKVQGQSTSNPCSISQAAAVAALSGPQNYIEMMREAFKGRHDRVIPALNKLPGVSCEPADGAFYALPSFIQTIKDLPGINNDIELAGWLLESAGVAMVPGTAFGAPGFLRLSYATSMENLETAIARIDTALQAAL
ncbi:MAG: pyridoxal phosphate-dependent aminotransferase [Xanthomonadales bacterium]|nr:pyridoxal phosphate-dependent aminotransferase [Xanthomonadales bacterium]